MSELEIKNGKFYRNGLEEKPEIGNIDQIKCLKEHNDYVERCQTGIIIDPDVTYNPDNDEMESYFGWKCICGRHIGFEDILENSLEAGLDPFEEKIITCICHRKWKVFEEDYEIKAKILCKSN